jgi:hypothetical protein
MHKGMVKEKKLKKNVSRACQPRASFGFTK